MMPIDGRTLSSGMPLPHGDVLPFGSAGKILWLSIFSLGFPFLVVGGWFGILFL